MADSPQLTRLQARINGIPVAVRQAIVPTLKKNAEELAAAMARLAEPSRDTGAMIESIEVTLPGQATPAYSQPGGSRTAGELETLVTVGNSDVRYAHLVEYGTTETTEQPFFWPAVRLLRKRLTNRTKRAIGKVVRERWSK